METADGTRFVLKEYNMLFLTRCFQSTMTTTTRRERKRRQAIANTKSATSSTAFARSRNQSPYVDKSKLPLVGGSQSSVCCVEVRDRTLQ